MTGLPEGAASEVLDLACEIQQIPGTTFYESERGAFTLNAMQSCGMCDVHTDLAGNILGRLPGKTSSRLLVLSAHMDSVFPRDFPLHLDRQPTRITGPGIGDNALGLAALLSLPNLLKTQNLFLPGDLWLAGTVCEEGLGNLRGIQAVTDFFGSRPLAYISLEGMGLGNILHRGLGVERFRVSIQTRGGHSWVDYGTPSAVHELVGLAGKLAALRMSHRPRTTLNIGVIQGGTSINSIAAHAMLEVDLRSESQRNLHDIAEKVKKIASGTVREGIELNIERVGWRPAGEIPVDHPLVKLTGQVLRGMGIQPHTDIASTEANHPLSLGYPALTIGVTTGDRAHTAQEYIHTGTVVKGLLQIVGVVSRIWDTL